MCAFIDVYVAVAKIQQQLGRHLVGKKLNFGVPACSEIGAYVSLCELRKIIIPRRVSTAGVD